MARTCPQCGMNVEVTISGVCPSCFSMTYGVAKLPGRVEARICRYCGRVRIGGRWFRAESFAEAVEAVARYEASKAKPVPPLHNVALEGVEFTTRPNWTTRVSLKLASTYRGARLANTVEIVVTLKPSICPLCKTRVSGEYDTLLNLLDAPEDMEDEVVEAVLSLGLEAQLVDIIRVREGLGVYLTNRGAASKLLRSLSRRYRVVRLGMAHEDVGIDSSGRRRARTTINVRILGRKR
ncbi:MAG: 60S ribosomal export protein NMD3 [Desulfurococcales archaeon]|nr:60S ribosomal export protein NMD3 [Desulfurococcales archaeon]